MAVPPDLRGIGALLCAIPQTFLETLKTARDVYILCTKDVIFCVNLFGLTTMMLSGLCQQKCTFAFGHVFFTHFSLFTRKGCEAVRLSDNDKANSEPLTCCSPAYPCLSPFLLAGRNFSTCRQKAFYLQAERFLFAGINNFGTIEQR